MLSSVLPHTRFCKASRRGGAFSGLVCLDRKYACSASSDYFEVQCPGLSPSVSLDVVPFTLLCQHFIAMPKGRISGLLAIEGILLIDSLAILCSNSKPARRCWMLLINRTRRRRSKKVMMSLSRVNKKLMMSLSRVNKNLMMSLRREMHRGRERTIPLSVGGDGSGPSLLKKPSFDLNIPLVEHQVYELMEEEIKRRKAKLADLLEALIQREAERYPNIRELPLPKAMVERLIESLGSDQIKPKKKMRAMRPILQISKSF
ncbi:hypothetical protein FXO37_07920 [Capsicum annuum]|nr:hypothetical protein FXO37_07920 [Capsicum annuum]